MIRFCLPVIVVLAFYANCSGQVTIRIDGVTVNYSGVSERYAQAIGRTVSSARASAIETFGFDMPDTIVVDVNAKSSGKVRLFNDGQDRFSLTVRSEQDLAQPSSSGVFHLYGLCHEVGHLAMYRPIRDHSWLTYAAAEGWAHYVGSRLVDSVYEKEGAELWPDRYDYRNDGTRRLESQLNSDNPNSVVRCAGLWKELVELVGDQSIADLFAAWGAANVDPTDPGKALKLALDNSPHGDRLSKWWIQAEQNFIVIRPSSGFATETASADQLDGQPRELALDDGKQSGKNSSAGSGHGVRFETDGGPAYVTSIRIHGSRYGGRAPPNEDFGVWLCDDQFKQIAEFKYPYSKFKRAAPKWVTLKTKPTKVPKKFIVCVGFNPTATKGVYVGFDEQASGKSISGLPGRPPRDFERGDWMIRVNLEQAKHDFALKPGEGGADKQNLRTWTDSTGDYRVEAEFVSFKDGTVWLKKSDGEVITVPLDALSQTDQDYVKKK